MVGCDSEHVSICMCVILWLLACKLGIGVGLWEGAFVIKCFFRVSTKMSKALDDS